MPLSKGRVDGDTLVCCYHGLAFDCSGESPPSGLAVRSYPVAERCGAIWVWMGEPQLAAESQIFDCPQLDPEGADGLRVYFHVKAITCSSTTIWPTCCT